MKISIQANKHTGMVDVVYTWVTDSEEHRQRRHMYLPSHYKYENRFTDHQELRYSLRSLFKFGNSFIKTVYIVCDDKQRPSWKSNHENKARSLSNCGYALWRAITTDMLE